MTVIKSRPYITALGGSSMVIYKHLITFTECHDNVSDGTLIVLWEEVTEKT